MQINVVKKKYVKELTVMTAGLTGLALLVFQLFIPEWYCLWFPLIPAFFYLFGLLYIWLFAFSYTLGVEKIAMSYLTCKVLKFVLSVLVLLFYGFVIGHDVVAFTAAFIVFYFAFLIFETCFFLRFEAKLKLSKQVKNEKTTVHSNDVAAVVGSSVHDSESGDRR